LWDQDQTKMKTLLLIDGNAIMHRAYHALPPFKTKKGIPTHVIYGFFSMLFRAVSEFKPTHVVVCFDTPKPTFRNKIFKQYQAQRPKIHDDFISQIPLLKEALEASGIKQLEKDGFEADDVIGTLAKQAGKENMKVLILTGDRDILQLVDRNIFVIAPQLGLSNLTMYDEKGVKNKMSVTPSEIPDLKALTGDPSDNYPGAKGIGPKTAAQLIRKFRTVEKLFTQLEKVDNIKMRIILESEKKSVFLSKKLAQIDVSVPLDFDLHTSGFKGFHEALKEYLTKLEIKSLIKRIFAENKPAEKKEPEKEDKNQMGLF